MYVYTCEPDFGSMMTCIYTAWERALKVGHDQVRLETEPVEQLTLFEEYVHVAYDVDKEEKVIRSIKQKISMHAFVQIYYVAMSAERDAVDVIYRFLIRAFAYGDQVLQQLTDPCIARFFELRRAVGNEAHFFREFARFVSVNNQVYVCHLEPKNHILLFVAEHFSDRMPSEHWMIIDDRRRLAVIHPKDEPYYMRDLSELEFHQLAAVEKNQDEYTDMWKAFFDAIAIRQRYNPKCQRNLMPIWMRKHVTEFRE